MGRDMTRQTIINKALLGKKVEKYVRKLGRIGAKPILLLFFVMISKDTPRKDKLLILSTLSYVVLPIDILDVKRLPVIGWFDEITSLSVTYQKVCNNITPEIESKVESTLDKWFSEYTEYVELPA
jgi:uncharacterized membrane protein YkvA (DUF1232 family)